ncbi:hypothetical protein KLA_15725 [Cellulophaga geojensis KL-A]|uniref:Uncharacterized protein n=1 Tax=Cellulophaga geojensis KL-A TaxID=1328323 RepID=A0ABN0RK41_9FLAO|nr:MULTISPECIES: hypothetical protein [Cellulophaga]EWH11460.1 hypothetical protein KLA_15725 [Cellulophaga geojensis KL-A]MDO6855331.1 hypothetical protein [Cellulophaga lytica]
MTGQRTHLEVEESYLNKIKVDWGTKGSSRPDVFNTKTGDVYDYKFTKRQPSQLGKAQRVKNATNIPNIGNQTPIYPN